MSASRCDLLRGQFDLTWSLSEYHMARLEPEDFLWEPAPLCWTVRADADGTWVADWADTEPEPENDPSCTVARMVARVNSELMKNVAEIGQLRLLRAASAQAHG
ncbi:MULTISPECIES: hypothetical protein [unclassified Streptomyces]|uniref:hypothetical protein n=1 Tax=Streptomyces sp. NPDC055082 TaxID=3365718 RepID=UPI0037CF7357